MKIALAEYTKGKTYDLAVATCGYEARSIHFLDVEPPTAKKSVAIGYGSHEVLSFETNLRRFKDSRFQFSRVADEAFSTFFENLLGFIPRNQEPLRVFIDISCLTRLRLAAMIEALSKIRCEVDFSYSLAKFSRPKKQQPPNQFLQPVSTYFAGWSGDLDQPVAILSGLGYEYMRAIGTIEHLDASDVWLFFPTSPIQEYDAAVSSANELLIREVEPSRIIRYPVDDFISLCRNLFSLSGSLRETHRCAILPLGPKQFALAAFLTGAMYRDVSVWRASAGGFAEPVERLPSKHHFRVSVSFSKITEAD